MKVKVVASIIILSLSVVLTSCSKHDNLSLTSSPTPTISLPSPTIPARLPVPEITVATPEPTILPDADSQIEASIEPVEDPNVSPAATNTLLKNESDENKIKFQKYIDAAHADSSETLLFSSKEDLDLDGNDEVVLALGTPKTDKESAYISKLYVLRDKDGEIELLDENLASGGYSIYEVRLIRLQNLPETYIYCGLTNGFSMSGFEILEVSENQIDTKVRSASPGGEGEDTLQDVDKDGQFDSYGQYRYSYDVDYYSLNRSYILDQGEFILNKTAVDIPEYPEKVQEVILQYLVLSHLDLEKSPEADERLAELCSADLGGISIFERDKIWYEALSETIISGKNEIEFNITESGPQAKATLTYLDAQKAEHTLHFHLAKLKDKWQIDSIKK